MMMRMRTSIAQIMAFSMAIRTMGTRLDPDPVEYTHMIPDAGR